MMVAKSMSPCDWPIRSVAMAHVAAARRDIGKLLHDRSHDDGSYAPLFIRFAWHLSGTYDKASGTGGSNGCTMRFDAESKDPENAGLQRAKDRLAPVVEKYKDSLSCADIWTLAGYVAIEETGGPHIPFSYGRKDFSWEEAVEVYGPTGCPFGDGKLNPCGSRLPAADLGPDPNVVSSAPRKLREKPTIDHVRNTFRRMGFDDRETVALIVLGHQYGRCHPDVSGYDGPWYAFDPSHWNVYMHGLGYMSLYSQMGFIEQFREDFRENGKRQFTMNFGGAKWMMLLADMALWWDDDFRKEAQRYDRNRRAFHEEACAAWKKLTELGCDDLKPEA